MSLRGMAALASEVAALGVHVYIEIAARIEQGRIEITMLDRVAPAAKKMANPAIIAGRTTDRGRNKPIVRRHKGLFAELCRFRHRIAGFSGEF